MQPKYLHHFSNVCSNFQFNTIRQSINRRNATNVLNKYDLNIIDELRIYKIFI
jgi:hypothetical protein